MGETTNDGPSAPTETEDPTSSRNTAVKDRGFSRNARLPPTLPSHRNPHLSRAGIARGHDRGSGDKTRNTRTVKLRGPGVIEMKGQRNPLGPPSAHGRGCEEPSVLL